ncbi:MAG: AAA family ATPase [Candidatus Jordarchaeaceae archaeon]
MFEFKMSYKEPGYHKPGDPPFSFPPEGVDSKINANLVEIEGRNGTGKTTLLNCLALALGYLDQEKELERKPILKQKLKDLDENLTLEYRFRICCNTPEPVDLIVERAKGQKQRCWLNSKPITIEIIDKKFEIIFLTEDDPKKVVNSILGKLSKYFDDLEKGLVSLQNAINRRLIEIKEFREFKKKEENMLKEIKSLEKNIESKTKRLKELKEKFEKVELKEQLKSKLELLSNQSKITENYTSFKKRYDQLKDKTDSDIIRKLSKERFNLRLANEDLKEINDRIMQICSSLGIYGINIQSSKLLDDDYSELNELNRKIQPQKQKEAIQMRMVDDMIALFQRYPDNDIVPLMDKQVREVLQELHRVKARIASDRVFSLINTLNSIVGERKAKHMEIDKIQNKIAELSQKSRDLMEFDKVEKEFLEIQDKYIKLQNALKENRTELLSKWHELSLIDDNLEDVKKQINDLDVSKRADESIISKLQENLKLLRENATAKPKYEEKENELKDLYESISRLRESIFQWIQILRDPTQVREQFGSVKQRPGFGLQDYDRFIKAVGEYLGNQFEPIAYDYKFHEVKFFDIERDAFTTKEERRIPINKLSQGQSKITTLTGVFKKMDPDRKKIVLIDEIADLDPENLQFVKDNLLEEYKKGSLALAVLVRPPRESSKILEIRGWG